MSYIEESNYARDPRVAALTARPGLGSVDRRTMTAPLTAPDADGEMTTIPVRVRFAVCDTCEGRGAHVNPSIDASGLSGDDFDRDPDFAEDYFRGAYDVQCYGCRGERVVPEVAPCGWAQARHVVRWRRYAADEAAYEAMCRMERAMGA